jgi:hypothetical protein
LARKVGEIDKSTLNRYVSPTRERSRGTPTPERRAKEPDGFETKIEKAGTVYREPEISHKARDPLEIYKSHFTETERMALNQFCKDYHTAMLGEQITSRYDGMPRLDGGHRHGDFPDHYRQAKERGQKVWDALTPAEQEVIAPLLEDFHNQQTGRRWTPEDVAISRGVGYRDKNTRIHVWLGMAKSTGDRIYYAYRAIVARSRQPKAPTDTRALPQKPRQISRNTK